MKDVTYHIMVRDASGISFINEHNELISDPSTYQDDLNKVVNRYLSVKHNFEDCIIYEIEGKRVPIFIDSKEWEKCKQRSQHILRPFLIEKHLS